MAKSKRSNNLLQQLVQSLIDDGVTADTFDLDSMPFAEMEMFGHGLGKLVAAEIQQALTEHQATRMNAQAGDQYDCPQCGRTCAVESASRTLKTLDGDVEFAEPKCVCKKCRKSFFPSA